MTVVCYKNGVMASDSRSTFTGTAHISDDNVTKIFELNNGAVVGFSGDVLQMRDFLKLMYAWDAADTAEVPPSGHRKCLALMCWGGAIWVFRSGFWRVITDQDYYAIGSGEDYATGYLAAGGEAEDCVDFVKTKIADCGGRTQALECR